MSRKDLNYQLKSNGNVPLDYKETPVNKVSDLEYIPMTDRFLGMTVTVLDAGDGKPADYWYVGDTLYTGKWEKKNDTLRLEKMIAKKKNKCVNETPSHCTIQNAFVNMGDIVMINEKSRGIRVSSPTEHLTLQYTEEPNDIFYYQLDGCSIVNEGDNEGYYHLINYNKTKHQLSFDVNALETIKQNLKSGADPLFTNNESDYICYWHPATYGEHDTEDIGLHFIISHGGAFTRETTQSDCAYSSKYLFPLSAATIEDGKYVFTFEEKFYDDESERLDDGYGYKMRFYISLVNRPFSGNILINRGWNKAPKVIPVLGQWVKIAKHNMLYRTDIPYPTTGVRYDYWKSQTATQPVNDVETNEPSDSGNATTLKLSRLAHMLANGTEYEIWSRIGTSSTYLYGLQNGNKRRRNGHFIWRQVGRRRDGSQKTGWFEADWGWYHDGEFYYNKENGEYSGEMAKYEYETSLQRKVYGDNETADKYIWDSNDKKFYRIYIGNQNRVDERYPNRLYTIKNLSVAEKLLTSPFYSRRLPGSDRHVNYRDYFYIDYAIFRIVKNNTRKKLTENVGKIYRLKAKVKKWCDWDDKEYKIDENLSFIGNMNYPKNRR